jgi:drug/metabolite transporter (DMT)-like permease
MLQFGVLWFSIGFIWNSSWFLLRRDYRNVKGDSGRKTSVAVVIALLEGAATGLFYMAIKAMENPAVVSFIGNIGPVFVTVMGILLLRERFRTSQLLGILITITGVFVINYREGGFTGFLDPGSVYVIFAALLFSLATIVGRRWHHLLVPGYMSLIRSFLLAVVMVILFFNSGEMVHISLGVWRDLAVGSLLETLIVIIFAYQALKLIEATKTSLIISTKGVWTLILAWIFLGLFPTGMQMVGGLLTLVGVWLITWTRTTSPRE